MLLISALLFCIAVTPRLGVAQNEKSIAPASTTSTSVETTTTTLVSTTTSISIEIASPTTLPAYLTISDPCKYDNTHRHQIVAGDTLWDLSQRYHVAMIDIIRCNNWIEGPDHLLLVGDKIILPPKSWETPVTTTTSSTVVSTVVTSPPTVVTVPTTVTKTLPAPPSGNRATHPQCPWEDEIRAAFANNGASVATQDFFVAVAWRESGCKHLSHNPNTATKDDSYGLFQINMRRDALGPLMNSWGYSASSLLNGYINIEATVRLWQYCGKGPWIRPYSCSYN